MKCQIIKHRKSVKSDLDTSGLPLTPKKCGGRYRENEPNSCFLYRSTRLCRGRPRRFYYQEKSAGRQRGSGGLARDTRAPASACCGAASPMRTRTTTPRKRTARAARTIPSGPIGIPARAVRSPCSAVRFPCSTMQGIRLQNAEAAALFSRGERPERSEIAEFPCIFPQIREIGIRRDQRRVRSRLRPQPASLFSQHGFWISGRWRGKWRLCGALPARADRRPRTETRRGAEDRR